jgi:hypothetical protein
MIVLENGDLLEGDATSAAEVDFTLHGLDNNVLTQLADGQLANSKGTLYTANSTDVISAIILVNTGAAHNHVNLYLKPSGGTSRRLIAKDLQLEPNYSLHFDGAKVLILNSIGGVVTTGFDGSGGTSGTSGTSGVAGSHGTSGTSGSSGTHGTSGSSGAHGTSGTSGTSGSTGTHGTSGTSGTGYPIRCVQVVVVDPATQVGTGNGKAYFVVPDELTNMNLVRIAATLVGSAGTGGSCGVAITNTGSRGTASIAMLSTNMQIEGSELSTRTSATPGTIDTSADGILTGDLVRIDVPNVHSTAGTGLIVEMAFAL